MPKNKPTTIRLNTKEFPEAEKRARELSKHLGRSINNLICWLINSEWEKIFYDGSGRDKR